MVGMGFMQGEANICNGQYLTRSFGHSNGGLTLCTDPNSGQYGGGGHRPLYGIDRRCVEYFSWSIFDATFQGERLSEQKRVGFREIGGNMR